MRNRCFRYRSRFDCWDRERNIICVRMAVRRNERDSETLAGILEEMNFTAVEHPEDADLILMNTCAIRKNAEDKVLGEIGSLKRLKRKKPDLLFGLCGCMAQEEDVVAKLLETYRHVNLIFGTHNIHRLPELLYDVMVNGNRSVEVLSKEGDVIENLPVRRFGKHKAWVNIMYGCDKFCTYCIVPYTRGEGTLPYDGGYSGGGTHSESRGLQGNHAAWPRMSIPMERICIWKAVSQDCWRKRQR